jgi:hypothetical protein
MVSGDYCFINVGGVPTTCKVEMVYVKWGTGRSTRRYRVCSLSTKYSWVVSGDRLSKHPQKRKKVKHKDTEYTRYQNIS